MLNLGDNPLSKITLKLQILLLFKSKLNLKQIVLVESISINISIRNLNFTIKKLRK